VLLARSNARRAACAEGIACAALKRTMGTQDFAARRD
jgi:hypothetical protein